MKKINSIWYGPAILKCGLLFSFVIPLLLFIISRITDSSRYLFLPIGISAAIGVSMLLFLIVLLIIELRQDKKINAFYAEHKNTKAALSSGYYECQNCGNQRLSEEDTVCHVCGMKFPRE